VITVDFETEAITNDPLDYPPVPVGVAIKLNDEPSFYERGTPTELGKRLRPFWDEALLFHNASFDVLVAHIHCGLPLPRRVHDTLALLFLRDPYARTLSLKPNADALLDMPPNEQDDIKAWIIANVPGATARNFGAHIARAPYDLVAPYACGDVDRTKALFDLLSDYRDEAYDREMAIVPVLLENEATGIRVDADRLAADAETFTHKLERVDQLIHGEFGSLFDIDSNNELADQIEKLTHEAMPRTEKGARRTDKEAIETAHLPRKIKALLLYRSALAQSLRTFVLPWARMSEGLGGQIKTHWNAIRGASERKGGGGARTGRLSSEPNFQNIPSPEKVEALQAKLGSLLGWDLAKAKSKFTMPAVRSYIIPWEDGWTIFGRDFSQQELRLLAHFEDDVILHYYKQFPDLDVHAFVGEMIKEVTGKALPRKTIKVLNFCTIYGGGAKAIARQGGMSEGEAKEVRDLYFATLPSIGKLMRRVSGAADILTLGGRAYYPEAGHEYKLLNYLIQGSAADQTKEALRRWDGQRSEAKFYLTVHDELVFSCPRRALGEEMRKLREAMDGAFADRLDVPFRSDGYAGPTWGDRKALDD
jgi:DNA polymerase-1